VTDCGEDHADSERETSPQTVTSGDERTGRRLAGHRRGDAIPAGDRRRCRCQHHLACRARPRGSSIPYAVSKAALDHLTRLLAVVAGPEVRVNAVSPGLIDTDWTAGWTEIREQVRGVAPLRRSGTPDDVADAVLGVLRSSYQTGTVVPVDSGLSLRW